MIYANGVASFCVEKFGVENKLEINKNELENRINFIKNHNISKEVSSILKIKKNMFSTIKF